MPFPWLVVWARCCSLADVPILGTVVRSVLSSTLPALKLERETGFEPATDGLGSRCATTALLPPVQEYRTLSGWRQRRLGAVAPKLSP